MSKQTNNTKCRFWAAVILGALSFAGYGSHARADNYYPETNAHTWGPFELYWNAHGGLAQFGMPRTDVFPVKEGYDAQWFERAMFTYNPKNPDPYKVELQLLGAQAAQGRAADKPFQRTNQNGSGTYFEATGHNLSGKLLAYWNSHGGLPIYGYPISEAFTERNKSDGKDYTVQYFERNRLELHPELAGTAFEVQLGLLGSELLDARGGPSAFARLGDPLLYPPPTKLYSPTPGGGLVEPPGIPRDNGTPVPVPVAPALPAPASQVLYQADFAAPDLSAWQTTAPLGSVGATAATWSVVNGALMQSGTASSEGSDDAAVIATRDRSFTNFTMDAYYYASSGEPVGAVFRYSNNGFYMLRLYPSGVAPQEAKATLYRVSGGRATQVAVSRGWSGYKLATWQRITVSASGSSLAVAVDGQPVLGAADSSFTAGAVGFYAYADGTARFDNVRVSALSSR